VAQAEIEREVLRHLPLVLNEGKERPESHSRVGDFEIALHE
jgi:hypothetical protein